MCYFGQSGPYDLLAVHVQRAHYWSKKMQRMLVFTIIISMPLVIVVQAGYYNEAPSTRSPAESIHKVL